MLRNHLQAIDAYKLRSYMIEETSTTPFAGISVIDNSLLIQGQIYLSLKMSAFRTKVLELLDSYYKHGNQLKKIRIDLDIMETGSLGWIYQVLTKVWNQRNALEEVEIIWYYDREQLGGLREGQKISSRSGIPMTFISKS